MLPSFWSFFRIASRIAATVDAELLTIRNRNHLIKSIKDSRGVRDPKEAFRIQKEVDDLLGRGEIPEEFDLPFPQRIVEFARQIDASVFEEFNNPARKAFVQWLGQGIRPDQIPSDAELQRVVDFFVAHNFDVSALGPDFEAALRNVDAEDAKRVRESNRAFSPTSSKLEEFEEVDDFDGFRMFRFDRHSGPGPEATHQFLIDLGDFGDLCIGKNYGKSIAYGDLRAFIIFDPSGSPVAFTHNESPQGDLKQLKGKSNSKIENPRLVRAVFMLLIRNFDWNQFANTESSWAQTAIFSIDLDDPKIPPEKRNQLERFLASEESSNPSSLDSLALQAVRTKFKDFALEEFSKDKQREWWDNLRDERAKMLVASMPIQILESSYAQRGQFVPSLERQLAGEDAINRLRSRILKYPVNAGVISTLEKLKATNPVLESLHAKAMERLMSEKGSITAEEAESLLYSRPDFASKLFNVMSDIQDQLSFIKYCFQYDIPMDKIFPMIQSLPTHSIRFFNYPIADRFIVEGADLSINDLLPAIKQSIGMRSFITALKKQLSDNYRDASAPRGFGTRLKELADFMNLSTESRENLFDSLVPVLSKESIDRVKREFWGSDYYIYADDEDVADYDYES